MTAQPTTATGPRLLNDWHTASLAARMGAWAYEGILLFGLLWFAVYAFDALTQSTHALMLRPLRMAYVFIIAGIYFSYFWARGQTLPMKTWKFRLRTQHGQPVSLGRAAWRYTLSWLWFLPPLLALQFLPLPRPSPSFAAAAALLPALWLLFYMALSLVLPQRQFLHDVLAQTRLERYTPAQPQRGLV